MGSENNMVAVPETNAALAERMRAAVTYAYMPMAVRNMLSDAATRLASPQPDAQQGEVEKLRALLEERATVACDAECDGDRGLHDIGCQRAAAALNPTPSSPALDAATIERCAQQCDQMARQRRAQMGHQMSGPAADAMNERTAEAYDRAAAAIRALPNAEKRHG